MSEVQIKFINRPAAWKTEFMTIRKTQVKKKNEGNKTRIQKSKRESKTKRIQYVSDGCLWTEGENKTNRTECSKM